MYDIIRQVEQIAHEQDALARERDAYLYITALDRGDFETMEPLLERAQGDPLLAQMLDEIHEAIAKEDGIVVSPEELQRAQSKIKHIMRQFFDE
jgi:hypothetical protein